MEKFIPLCEKFLLKGHKVHIYQDHLEVLPLSGVVTPIATAHSTLSVEPERCWGPEKGKQQTGPSSPINKLSKSIKEREGRIRRRNRRLEKQIAYQEKNRVDTKIEPESSNEETELKSPEHVNTPLSNPEPEIEPEIQFGSFQAAKPIQPEPAKSKKVKLKIGEMKIMKENNGEKEILLVNNKGRPVFFKEHGQENLSPPLTDDDYDFYTFDLERTAKKEALRQIEDYHALAEMTGLNHYEDLKKVSSDFLNLCLANEVNDFIKKAGQVPLAKEIVTNTEKVVEHFKSSVESMNKRIDDIKEVGFKSADQVILIKDYIEEHSEPLQKATCLLGKGVEAGLLATKVATKTAGLATKLVVGSITKKPQSLDLQELGKQISPSGGRLNGQ